jgi:hypothetical protein
MKKTHKIAFAFLLAAAGALLQAQTNTFPASGNVGIGTTNPQWPLDINGFGARITSGNGNAAELDLIQTNGGRDWSLTSWGSVAGGGTLSNKFSIYDNTLGAHRLVIDGNGNVGIGTTNPQWPLDISGFGVRITSGNGNAAQFDLIQTNGGHDWALASWGSAAGSGTLSNKFSIYDSTSGAHRLVIDGNGNIGIGTTNPGYALDVPNGIIHAQGVIVNTSGADYVFAPNYKLMPLAQVEQAIKRDQHLPGIPSAQEMSSRGVSMGDLQAKLLAKVEELTLHVIAQQKELDELKAENAAMQTRLNAVVK